MWALENKNGFGIVIGSWGDIVRNKSGRTERVAAKGATNCTYGLDSWLKIYHSTVERIHSVLQQLLKKINLRQVRQFGVFVYFEAFTMCLLSGIL